MHRIILLFVVISLPGSLWAADPIIGTWVLNSAKTSDYEKSLNLTPPDPSTFQWSSRTEVYKELESALIELTLTIINADGSTEVAIVPGLLREESQNRNLPRKYLWWKHLSLPASGM